MTSNMSKKELDSAERRAVSTLFFVESDGGLDLKVGYLEFLGMQPSAPAEVVKLGDLMRMYPSEQVERDICSVLDAQGWRPHLVACIALLCGRTTPRTLWYLWGAIQANSWVAPQLVATASIVDPEFSDRALWALASAHVHSKSAGALAAMLVDKANPDEELRDEVVHGLAVGESHPDDPAHIARAWKQSVLRLLRPLEMGR